MPGGEVAWTGVGVDPRNRSASPELSANLQRAIMFAYDAGFFTPCGGSPDGRGVEPDSSSVER